MTSPFLKDPGDRIDYTINFTDWLNGDTITGTPSWTVPSGLTLYAQSNTTTAATVWLSGGTNNEEYVVVCQITTTGGRIKQQGFIVKVKDDLV